MDLYCRQKKRAQQKTGGQSQSNFEPLPIIMENSDSNVGAFWSASDEKAVPDSEVSLLNKVLNDKLNQLNEGTPEVSKLQRDPNSPLYSAHTFEELRIKPELIKAIHMMGFVQPSKIQEAALPVLLCEPPQDIIAQSQSGTGKTATFLLAMLNRIDSDKTHPQCICVAPTFELAQQIGEVAKKMAQFLPNVHIRFAVKGETVPRDMTFTEQIVIGTPGKMLDWMMRKHIDAAKIVSFALDEADVMIGQQGYQDKSIRIHNSIVSSNPTCQCMLFSATYSDAVIKFADKLIADPTVITIRRQDQSLPYIRQYFVRCRDREDKYQSILSLYSVLTISSCIIFCYTRSSTVWLARRFKEKGRDVALLHGELEVTERARVVEQFKRGEQKVLITTNVVARGLDIPQVSLVINYDPPVTYEESPQPDNDTYLHRMGRTGRFGKPGIVINLVDSDIVMDFVLSFQQHFGREIAPLDASDYDQMERIEKDTHRM
ncbi:ATP-dependent RNA helicase ddx19a [Globodera pallida]|uniref:RNA helicase n=1 Tax=Globodera pallida TaxID=36090 RepID=A0A183BSW1_GLOPA|nr:ATP-dependent RNA helicase ddx19a [Globodera pallida]